MIIPEYALPDALIIPHYDSSIRDTLEAIARAASEEAGVILLSGDPHMSRQFVDRCNHSERFSIIAAPYDSPWVRDRSPIAVRHGDECRWVVPTDHMPERENDAKLFQSIVMHPLVPINLHLPQGNLVAGTDGTALSTTRVLVDNDLTSEAGLRPFLEPLGIRNWLLFESFKADTIAHMDCYARFAGPDLLFLAWQQDDTKYRERAATLEHQLKEILPTLETVRLPVCMNGEMFNSPLNWIQLDDLLLLPDFPETSLAAKAAITKTLRDHGFRVVYIDSPTTDSGGALHCLTASVFTEH